MPDGVPVEVVCGEVGQISAEVPVRANHPKLARRDVLVVARKDHQVVRPGQRRTAWGSCRIGIGQIVDAVASPGEPVEELEVVLAEVRRDAAAQIVTTKPNGRLGIP